MPHWLLSLLVHMLLVVFLGSFVARPAAQQCVAILGTIAASFSNMIDDSAEATAVRLEMPLDVGIKPEESPPDEELDRFAEVVSIAPPQADALERSASETLLAKAISSLEGDRRLRPGVHDAPSGSGQLPTALPATTPSKTLPPDEPAAHGDDRPPADTERDRFDEVVDQFIKFDIGRLRGAAGVEAKRAFDALGTDAIPALVRGLNKAAHIRASCPVMVISSKLQSALSMNQDRSLLEYAVENLGRDVPASAPYAAQVRTIQAHWEAIASGRAPSDAPSRLSRRLAQGPSDKRIEAAQSVIGKAAEFNDEERKELGWTLAAQLKGRDAKLRDAAHRALVALADGDDFGPAKKARPGEVQKAICQWYHLFDAERFDHEAQGLLAAGERLDERKQPSGAMHFYRRVVTEYSGSAAAPEAAKRLDRYKKKTKSGSGLASSAHPIAPAP
jgi:hypothetical protein